MPLGLCCLPLPFAAGILQGIKSLLCLQWHLPFLQTISLLCSFLLDRKIPLTHLSWTSFLLCCAFCMSSSKALSSQWDKRRLYNMGSLRAHPIPPQPHHHLLRLASISPHAQKGQIVIFCFVLKILAFIKCLFLSTSSPTISLTILCVSTCIYRVKALYWLEYLLQDHQDTTSAPTL